MRINRFAAVPAVALLSVSALTACNDKDTKSAATNAASNGASAATGGSSASGDTTSSASSSGNSSSSASADSTECPTSNTNKFAKTRFTADLGLAAGTFHRWIYKPYKNGSFTKGHIDKTDAIKAAGVALVDYKLLKNASDNAKANPTLCKAVAKPLSDAMDKVKSINTKQLLTGDVSALTGAEGALGSVLSGSKSSGNDVTESDSLSDAKKAVAGN